MVITYRNQTNLSIFVHQVCRTNCFRVTFHTADRLRSSQVILLLGHGEWKTRRLGKIKIKTTTTTTSVDVLETIRDMAAYILRCQLIRPAAF
jgi:hypothetical protein